MTTNLHTLLNTSVEAFNNHRQKHPNRCINLAYADLCDRDLEGVNFRDVDLSYADLRRTNLKDADLRGADLRDTALSGVNLEGAKLDYQIQEGLLEQIASIVVGDKSKLAMNTWHTCETVHCIGGWACELNDVAEELEDRFGTEAAGLLTLGAEAHSHFFVSNHKATEWLESIIAD